MADIEQESLYRLRVLVHATTRKILSTINYNIDEGQLGDTQFLHVLTSSSYIEPSDVLGKVLNEDGTIELYTWEDIREARDAELGSTDWTQIPDAPLSPERVEAFAVWRQQLRDLPQTVATPEEAYDALEVLLNTKP